jgi:hypothetical protein
MPADIPPPADPAALLPWHDGHAGGRITAPSDLWSARLWLAHLIGDDAALASLRLKALALTDGTELSQLDDQALIDHLAVAVAEGRLRIGGVRPELRRLVVGPAPAPATRPPPAAPVRREAAAAPPAAVETTFGSELDVAAMVAVLVQAAQDGVPFCEECARAAAEAAAA